MTFAWVLLFICSILTVCMDANRRCVRSCIASAAPPSLKIFNRWLEEHDASRNPSLKLEYSAEAGWHVRAEQDLEVGQLICEVPKSAVFSHRTSPFSAICPIDVEEASSADMILHLAASILYELRQGEASSWWGWLQMLPREMDILPTFWADEEIGGKDGQRALEILRGTEAAKELARKDAEGLSCSNLRELFAAVLPYYPSTAAHPAPPTFHDFAHAFNLVSTRGFVIDDYHVIALIPYCDMFNHSTLSSHTSLRTDRRAKEDYLSASSTRPDTVEMRVERMITAGEQVLTCYEDDIGDAKLLVEWGFITGEQAGPGLTWSPREMVACRPGSVGVFFEVIQRDRLATSLTGQQALVGPPSSDRPGLLNVWPDGRVSINLLAALHVRENWEEHRDVTVEALENSIMDTANIIETGKVLADKAVSIALGICELLEQRLAVYTEDVPQSSSEHGCPPHLAQRFVNKEVELLKEVLDTWRNLQMV